MEAVSAANKAQMAPKKRVAGNVKTEAPPKLKWKEEKELEETEAKILEAEEAVSEAEAKLNDPDFYKENTCQVAAMTEDLEGRRVRVKRLYDRWEELEGIRKAWDTWKSENG